MWRPWFHYERPTHHQEPARRILLAVILLLSVWVLWGISFSPVSTGQASKPNIILMLADDLDTKSIKFMPQLKTFMIDRGTTFENFFVTNTLCCPSRASILTGQYAHNHGVLTDRVPRGGLKKFREAGKENSTIATLLKAAGYRTMLVGKYLNGYWPGEGMDVPPGWDEWYAALESAYTNYNYQLNENGRLVSYGNRPEDYLTDVIARKTIDFIQRAASDTKPFFIYLATYAPHSPATPALRHQNEFPDATAPRTPSFNEQGISDKPEWVSRKPPLSPAEIQGIDKLYRRRLQSLLAVDEMIEKLIRTLETREQLNKTILLLTSDNGFHMGEHRLPPGKETPYEEDIRVPLIVRGPGVPAGRTIENFALNIDLAPTLAQLGGARTPDSVDGLSLVPLLSTRVPSINAWRKDFLVEQWPDRHKKVPQYSALRTQDYLYVEYTTGERELYDLRIDPHELNSLHNSAPAPLIKELAKRLTALMHCKGVTCWK